MSKKKKSFAEMKKQAISKKQLIGLSESQTSEAIQLTDEKSEFKVSAIVSTYNSERFIRGCLEDLVNQTLYEKGELEIIVIDSESEQNEKTIVEEFQRTCKNIVYIRTEKREGIYAAWNLGIKAASGLYITNANTDDRHRKNAFEVMVRALEQNPDIGLVYADVILTKTENETFERHTPGKIFRQLDYSRELLAFLCFIGPQPMWRKTLHNRYGYFDESFTSSGDWEFWLRIAQDTKMLRIPEILGLYLKSPQSLEHRSTEKKAKEDYLLHQEYIPKYLPTIEKIEGALATIHQLENNPLHEGFQLTLAKIKTILMQLRAVHKT
jgi:glycosyltransferase involved in cell wall biosynthesis